MDSRQLSCKFNFVFPHIQLCFGILNTNNNIRDEYHGADATRENRFKSLTTSKHES